MYREHVCMGRDNIGRDLGIRSHVKKLIKAELGVRFLINELSIRKHKPYRVNFGVTYESN